MDNVKKIAFIGKNPGKRKRKRLKIMKSKLSMKKEIEKNITNDGFPDMITIYLVSLFSGILLAIFNYSNFKDIPLTSLFEVFMTGIFSTGLAFILFIIFLQYVD